jgi:serine/threonine protein kinase
MTINFCSKGHENPETNVFCQVCGEKLSPPTINLVAGAVLEGRYRIVQQIGQGGFGRTYLCEDLNRFNEPCVLKEFAPQVHGTTALDKAKRLFEREANVLYKLQHPQIPKFRELFQMTTAGGGLFLVQDYVAGHTYRYALNSRLQQGQTFKEDEVRRLLVNILPVLEYTHSLGVIHRDIAPDNLIMRSSDGMPVLIDFGGVKQIAVNAEIQAMGNTEGLTRLGKVGYAPSEQMQRGVVSPHSDLYSLAATCLVLLTGQEPTSLLDPQTMKWKWRQAIQLSPDLAGAFDRMLEPQPADRFPAATEVLRALQNQQKSKTVPAIINPIKPTATPTPLTARPAVVAPPHKNQPTNQVLASQNTNNTFTPSSETTTNIGGGNWRQFLARTWIGILGLLAAIGLAWGVTSEVNKPKSGSDPAVSPSESPSPAIESPNPTESTSPAPTDETITPSPTTTESSTPENTETSKPSEPSGSGVNAPSEESTPRERRSRRRSRVNSEESSPAPKSRSSNSEESDQPSKSRNSGQSQRSSEAEKTGKPAEEEQPRRRRRRQAASEESEQSTPQRSTTTRRRRQSPESNGPNLEGKESKGNESLDDASPRTKPVRPNKPDKPDKPEPKKQQPAENNDNDEGPTITQPKPDEAPL